MHLPAVNTPQFDWALSRMPAAGHSPVPPVYQPEVAGARDRFAATNKRREVWIGYPTMKASWRANCWHPGIWIVPRPHRLWLAQPIDSVKPEPADAPANLFAPCLASTSPRTAALDTEALTTTSQFGAAGQRFALTTAPAALLALGLLRLVGGRKRRTGRRPKKKKSATEGWERWGPAATALRRTNACTRSGVAASM